MGGWVDSVVVAVVMNPGLPRYNVISIPNEFKFNQISIYFLVLWCNVSQLRHLISCVHFIR